MEIEVNLLEVNSQAEGFGWVRVGFELRCVER